MFCKHFVCGDNVLIYFFPWSLSPDIKLLSRSIHLTATCIVKSQNSLTLCPYILWTLCSVTFVLDFGNLPQLNYSLSKYSNGLWSKFHPETVFTVMGEYLRLKSSNWSYDVSPSTPSITMKLQNQPMLCILILSIYDVALYTSCNIWFIR